MLIATREIHMGVPEGAAYENFGKRTGVREYVRLSTFLTQNLKRAVLRFTAIKGRVCPGGRTADTECQKTQ